MSDKPVLRGKVCQCSACGKVFTTTSGFDRHRIGPYDINAHKYGRRCLTEDELRAVGYAQNDRGRWFRPYRGAGLSHRRPESTIA